MSITLIQRALEASWDSDTTQSDDWSIGEPARGQCAVSAMVIQTYYGGKILRGTTNHGTVHYWNELEAGSWFDSTRSQFGPDEYVVDWADAAGEHLFDDTIKRYAILFGRVLRKINS